MSAVSSTTAGTSLLSLSSSKSWYGHAEPGAGMVGIAHALLAQQQQLQLPIVHLRTLNPMVVSMLETSSASGPAQGLLHMPRQAGPGARGSLFDGGLVLPRTGVSAFAFQVSLGAT